VATEPSANPFVILLAPNSAAPMSGMGQAQQGDANWLTTIAVVTGGLASTGWADRVVGARAHVFAR